MTTLKWTVLLSSSKTQEPYVSVGPFEELCLAKKWMADNKVLLENRCLEPLTVALTEYLDWVMI